MAHTDPANLAERVRQEHRRIKRHSSPVPSHDAMLAMIKVAYEAVEDAKIERRRWRRRVKPGSTERRTALRKIHRRLVLVEAPIKAERNRAARWGAWDRRYGSRLSAVSDAVIHERRRIWKMLNPGGAHGRRAKH